MKIFSKFQSWFTLLLAGGSLGATYYAIAAPNEKRLKSFEEKIKEAVPKTGFVKPKQTRKLLVFTRTKGFRHASIPTGKLALEILGKQTGAYEVVLSEELKHFEKENIQTYDAICFLNTTLDIFTPTKKERDAMSDEQKEGSKIYEKQLKENFINFIKEGKGFIGIHAATDTFYEWPEYGKMIGGYFHGHPWHHNTSVSIKVESGKENHPLVASWNGENVNFKEEIYQLQKPYKSSEYDMLLRLDTEKSDMNVKGIKRKDNDFGVSWIKDYGEGRVFYCSLGHNHHIYWNEKVLAHYLAGIQYALGDLDIPKEK